VFSKCPRWRSNQPKTNATLDALQPNVPHDLARVGVWGAIPGKRGHHESILQGGTPNMEKQALGSSRELVSANLGIWGPKILQKSSDLCPDSSGNLGIWGHFWRVFVWNFGYLRQIWGPIFAKSRQIFLEKLDPQICPESCPEVHPEVAQGKKWETKNYYFRTSRGCLCPNCVFEAQKFVHLRAILVDFPDTKLQELPGAWKGAKKAEGSFCRHFKGTSKQVLLSEGRENWTSNVGLHHDNFLLEYQYSKNWIPKKLNTSL